MTTDTGQHDGYALVSPQAFVDRMDHHWSHQLHLITSPALQTLWGIMAETFRSTIINSVNNVVDAPWQILQPPTGSGKTRGACLYAAMQAEANAQGSFKPVGVLIVTRLIEQADKMVSEINEHVGRVVAVSHHSGKPATHQELLDSDILIITHQAYVNAAHYLGSHREAQWVRFVTWRGGTRLLTIIDEALANVVDSNKVTVANLAQVLGYVSPELRHEYAEQLKVLDELLSVLKAHSDPQSRSGHQPTKMLWDDQDAAVQMPDMEGLRIAMKALPYDTLVLNENNDSSRDRIARKVDDTLRDAQAVMEQWAYYALKGKEHSINSAAFLLPWDVPGPVVLDATANANFLWDLFGSRARIVPTPSKVRDYSNVVLHVARATGVGKGNMIKNAKTRFPRLLAALETELGSDRSVFMCVHKDTEHVALTYARHFARFDVGHWGAIDGRNDWQTHDAAVIFGLSYRDRVWSTNQFFALQGHQDDEWLQDPVWKEHADVRQVMEQRQLSVSIIQAINRIRCRRVIDAQGRSPSADVYVILPKDKTGDAILRDIFADMPGLRSVPWAFEMDGPRVQKARSSSTREALIACMTNRLPGETAMPNVQRELSLSPLKLKKLKEALRDSRHPTTIALSRIGVGYVVRGAGRGAKTFLAKRAA